VFDIRGIERYNEASGFSRGHKHLPLFVATARIHAVRSALGLESHGLSTKLTTMLLSMEALSRMLAHGRKTKATWKDRQFTTYEGFAAHSASCSPQVLLFTPSSLRFQLSRCRWACTLPDVNSKSETVVCCTCCRLQAFDAAASLLQLGFVASTLPVEWLMISKACRPVLPSILAC